MEKVQATKTVFTVSQFLDWQRSGTLELSPIFQRRPVWKPSAKSQLIDSVVRGFPVPVVLLRQVQDLQSLSMKMEVVDGQQRLRTLLAFINPECLEDYDEKADSFTVRNIHNREISDKPFSRLPKEVKQALLGYELSTHVFPATTGDDLVFRIFARLNSTGLALKPQEVRNAEYHGNFKTLVYDLAIGHLDYWRRWRVFSNDAISRMDEAEAVSEYIIAMIEGIKAKDQRTISKFYAEHEEDLPQAEVLAKRFENVMLAIDKSVGSVISDSSFRRPALFFSLFSCIYDHMHGLKSKLDNEKPKTLPSGLNKKLVETSNQIREKTLTPSVQDAMERATADKTRRDIRHKFVMKALGLVSAR